MSTKYESADLILKLYDLRREATMREARQWMAYFSPESAQDVLDALMGEHSAHFRQVMSYWDMAAALVLNGAIDEQMFDDANAEHLFYFAKIAPFLEELRSKLGPASRLVPHLERLVMSKPDAKERLEQLREMSRAVAARRAQAANASAAERT
ncbi:MAG TPA: hypothetical protein VK421_17830 [Pyrinomonadaceae bacterium]|nr:hypothetical protein [Pyrinomonadaceae bacterium]